MTTVQKSIIFLVLYVAICLMTASTLKLPEFDCDGKGNVVFKNHSDFTKTEIVKPDGQLCTPVLKVLSSNCTQKGTKSITIVYGASVVKANSDHMVIGKNAKYVILSCEDQPIKAVATAPPFFVSTPSSITKHTMPIKYGITLSITGLSNPNGAQIGESFTLSLEGPDSKHKLQPTECKAFPTGKPANEHEIWKLPTNISRNCFNEPSVIEQQWTTKTNKTKLSIEMYAFRFATSSSVTIECSAYVCLLTDTTSPECTEKCIAAHRRRRAIHGIHTSPKLNATSTQIMVASTSFQVQLGDQNTGNSAARLSKNVQLYSVASIFVLMVTMMIR